ncbi:MAG: hypothetical protein ACW99Q_23450 [Candidatus Kariarchaeaceae archaeon]|jgi:hypothetical protein
MKYIISLILVGNILFSSCTWKQVIPNDDNNFGDLNDKLKTETLTIGLVSGNIIFGKDIQLSSDSTSWSELHSGKYHTVQSSTIRDICVVNRSRSGKTGLVVGLIGGAVIGVIMASSEEYEWLDVVEKGFRTAIGQEGESKIMRYSSGIIIGGLAGGLLGYTIGIIVGGTDKYVITQDNPRVKK